MPQNIRNNHLGKYKCRLVYDRYYDFMIHQGGTDPLYDELDEIAYIDFSKIKDVNERIYSKKVWPEAINNGAVLKNYGFTGVDNGQITYRKDKITNKEFLDIYTKSKLEIPEGDMRFFITPISGNTLDYRYPMEIGEDHMKLKGGFYQGFFKLEGFDYQVLPHIIEDQWSVKIRLRKRSDYEVQQDTLNYYNKKNKGMFFFLGTRAENKFWPFYKKDEVKLEEFYDKDCLLDLCLEGCSINHNNTVRSPYFDDEPDKIYLDDCKVETPDYIKEGYVEEETCQCGKGTGYFEDGYLIEPEFNIDCDIFDYIEKDLDIDSVDLKTAEGLDLTQRNFIRFTTDNKFMFFNHTPTGFTTDSWVEGTEVEFVRNQDYGNINLFPYMNHTPTGYTVDNVNELYKKEENTYRIIGDLYSNAIGFKINDDGSITYRYLIKDCDNVPTYIKIEEETSKEGIVKDNEWSDIEILFVHLANSNKCLPRENEKMKIYIKVNGFLKYISKELPMLVLRPLKDTSEKQETVPFNMSIGGGTQGLAEAIYLDYYNYLDYTLPLEKYFGGSFLGDIQSFSFSI